MGKIEKIGKLAEKGKAEKIVAFVRDKDKQVSLAAITALGRMADNEDAKNTLVSMVENEDADIRRAAVTSLGAASGSYVETRLRYCLANEKDPQVLAALRKALEGMKK